MANVGPTMRRKRLGAQLRELRVAAGIDPAQAAAELECSEAKIRHMENGRNAPGKLELSALLTLYRAGPEVFGVLDEVRREGTKRGWWSTYRLPAWFKNYVGFEADAIGLRTFELELIPGLLQTDAYARRIVSLAPEQLSSTEADRRITARLERQQRLTNEDHPLKLDAVISEAALHRVVQDGPIAGEQLRHLQAVADREAVSVRVLPLSTGLHASSGSFVILDFDADVSLPIGYIDHACGGNLVDDQEAVGKLDVLFQTLKSQAMSDRDSMRLVEQYAQRSESESR
jgi:transcriptional regulator with XRE-family HTH domain